MSYYVEKCSGCNDEFGNLVVVSNNDDRRDGKTESLMMIMMPSGSTIAGMIRKDWNCNADEGYDKEDDN